MNTKLIAKNPTAKHNYEILDTYETGIVLSGTEIKSIRLGKVNLKDSYASISNGECYVYNLHISPYEHGNIYNKDPLRPKKLLLHKKEILKLYGLLKQKGYEVTILEETDRIGYALIPLNIYFKGSFVKLELGLGKGKKLYDKREDLKKKDANKQIMKNLREKNL